MKTFHLHLVSDSTGETVGNVARAALVQFEEVRTIEHLWSMVRTERQLDKVLGAIEAEPGIVMFTVLNDHLRTRLRAACERLDVPCIAVLDPVIRTLAMHFGMQGGARPGRQHALDSEYFHRIEAMNFVLTHDDGQSTHDLNQADVVLVGVSRTSKTPTCIYLANRGIKAANIPLVPGFPTPEELLKADRPLIVGLTNDPQRLVAIRRNRLRMIDHDAETEYVDFDAVKAEVEAARRLCAEHGWPVIDVTRRSIEETAAAIIQLHHERQRRVG
ncbi:MAG: kinase/pyrophosphorylase [Alphaproteobacteria bacterium]|nr:kinase/pyrophosphorylase [Alphaproteobacteria bacterium]